MPRFRFGLQRVLEMREREEREHQIQLATLQRRRLDLERSVRECADRAREEREAQSGLLTPGGISVSGARSQAAAAVHELARAQRLAIELAGVMRQIEIARAALERAMARRRAVELLRERKIEQWRRDQDRNETRALDDIVSGAHARRSDPRNLGLEG